MTQKQKTLISMSGGKDSTAMALLAIELGASNLEFVFADTGHEHTQTYEYIEYLRNKLNIDIQVVKADFSERIDTRRRNLAKMESTKTKYVRKLDISTGKMKKRRIRGWNNKGRRRAIAALNPTGNPFLDLCILKGRFPSTRARFCSQELKHLPILQLTNQWMAEGFDIESWQGVRADESASRSKLQQREECERKNYTTGAELSIYRPILNWTVEDVFAMHKKHGIEPNPLYKQGMGRVGCMPCIHCGKSELKEIADRFPDEIDRVYEWELLVRQASKRGESSFFAADKTPEGRLSASNKLPGQYPLIHQVVEWSRTTRGGMNYDLFMQANEEQMCSSLYGLCE